MDDEILIIGAIAIGGYAVYKLTQPLTDTVGGVGSGVSSAVQGLGYGVNQIGQSTGNVASALGNTLASDIGLFDIPKQITNLANTLKNNSSSSSHPVTITTPQKTQVVSSKTSVSAASIANNAVNSIMFAKDAAKTNIVATVGNATVVIPKQVSIPPSLISLAGIKI